MIIYQTQDTHIKAVWKMKGTKKTLNRCVSNASSGAHSPTICMCADPRRTDMTHNTHSYYLLPSRLALCLAAVLLTTSSLQAQTPITTLSQITDPDEHYVVTADISGGAPGVATFNGTLEADIDPATQMPYRISGLSAPLFTTLTGTVEAVHMVSRITPEGSKLPGSPNTESRSRSLRVLRRERIVQTQQPPRSQVVAPDPLPGPGCLPRTAIGR